MIKKNKIFKILLLVLGIMMISATGYEAWKINKDMRENTPGKTQALKGETTESGINTNDWKTFSNQILGMSFLYPKEYCVGFFTKEDLRSMGYDHDPPSPEYFITVADSETECDAPFGPWQDLLDIQVFSNPNHKPVEDWIPSDVKVFMLPSVTIDGIKALRFFEGEGIPGKGAPLYNILFQKNDLIFSLFTSVDCTAKDGSCVPPRNQDFINKIATIAKTIQFAQ